MDPESQTGDNTSPSHNGRRPSVSSDIDDVNQPLLQTPEAAGWTPPPGFVWIQLALMSNVFLHAFDSTITVATYAIISSEFDAANTASWLTTSYLVTSTAVQPLYGRISDIFGRRPCFFVSTVLFGFGCLGCGLAKDIVMLNCMRALSGLGGGGLLTMGMLSFLFFPSLCHLARERITDTDGQQQSSTRT